MIDFPLDGNNYQIGTLSAFKQLHLSRKIAVLIPKLIPAFASMTDEGKSLKDLAEALAPATEALSEMSDADAEYVYNTCLSVVKREQTGGSISVWNEAAQRSQFADIDLGVMTQLVLKVIAENLGPFIRGLVAKAQLASPDQQ